MIHCQIDCFHLKDQILLQQHVEVAWFSSNVKESKANKGIVMICDALLLERRDDIGWD